MRIVAVGDLHGGTEGLFRVLDAETPDGLLCVGDWGDEGEVSRETWDALLVRVPVLTVYGNHDDLPLLHSLCHSDGSAVVLGQGERREGFAGGVSVGGVSGIWAKSHRKAFYVTDEDVAGYAAALAASGPVDILLTHGCPSGIADRTAIGKSGGQRCFLDLLKTVRPALYLCGHLHVPQHRDLQEPPCVVVNTGALPRGGSYVVLERENQSAPWQVTPKRLA